MRNIVITVEDFCKALNLHVIYPGKGEFSVSESEINRPGLQMTGFLVEFAFARVQMIGNAEMQYLLQLSPEALQISLEKLMAYPIPCIVFSRSHQPPQAFLQEAQKREIPLFLSEQATSAISHAITHYVDRRLAPSIVNHGVLLDIYGVGVMLTGESGMGKSESALELVVRGHRLIADDVVEIRRVTNNRLSGTAPSMTRHMLEIRGIGIIDVRYMYGVGAVIMEKSIDLVIELEMWQAGKRYNRLGMDEETITILEVEVPHILIPVRPGRNLAIIVEVAARNYRLKKLGYDAAKEFDRRWMEEAEFEGEVE